MTTQGPPQIASKTHPGNTPPASRERQRRECVACGQTFEQQRRGRPRKFCTTCVPPGTGAMAAKAWRKANPDRVEEYNQRRRRRVTTHWCTVCGRPFAATRSDALVCGRSQCRRAREDPEKRLERERRKNERRKAAKS